MPVHFGGCPRNLIVPDTSVGVGPPQPLRPISPHAPKRLYLAGNRVFRSDDRGGSWQEAGPDLTLKPPECAHDRSQAP